MKQMNKILVLTLILILGISNLSFGSVQSKSVLPLVSIEVLNTEGNVASNAYIEVFSFVENKVVDKFYLDKNGQGTFNYQEPKDIIKQNSVNNQSVFHYMFVIMNGDQLSTEGFTRTYFEKPPLSEQKNKDVNEYTESSEFNFFLNDNKSSIKTQTMQYVEPNLKSNESNLSNNASSDMFATNGVVSSIDLGSKKIKFAQISSTTGCKLQASLTNSSSITLSGTGIISYTSSFTSSSSAISGIRTSPYGEYVDYYTYYNLIEEFHSYQHGGQTYEFYRLRPTNWNGGITSSIRYSTQNNVPYSTSLPVINQWEKGSTAEIAYGESYSFGGNWAGSFTGPLSGNNYSMGISATSGSTVMLSRNHAGGVYVEYGSGQEVIERAIIKK